MNQATRRRADRGAALVLTLGLLALLVLLVLALAALVRVDAAIGATGRFQTQARQNAWLALDAALGELQRLAGPDARVTATGGIAGVPAGAAGNGRRHWCGVWREDGAFLGWLTSAATPATEPALQAEAGRITLVGAGSVGAESTNSEHVHAGRVPLTIIAPATGAHIEQGGIAWWVGDEGVKISAFSPAAERAVPGQAPVLAGAPAVALTMRNALVAHAGRLPAMLSYEQLRLLPTPGASQLAASVLEDNFHHVTLTARWVVPSAAGASWQTGRANVNTTSVIVWRAIAESANALPGVPDIDAGRLPGFANAIANHIAAAGTGKTAGNPFLSVAAFLGSPLLEDALAGTGLRPAEFATGMAGMLAVRSDTFRVRAYGDAVNPATGGIEARAWCEAVVQRTPANIEGGFGRRFVVAHFRWLGPEDI